MWAICCCAFMVFLSCNPSESGKSAAKDTNGAQEKREGMTERNRWREFVRAAFWRPESLQSLLVRKRKCLRKLQVSDNDGAAPPLRTCQQLIFREPCQHLHPQYRREELSRFFRVNLSDARKVSDRFPACPRPSDAMLDEFRHSCRSWDSLAPPLTSALKRGGSQPGRPPPGIFAKSYSVSIRAFSRRFPILFRQFRHSLKVMIRREQNQIIP